MKLNDILNENYYMDDNSVNPAYTKILEQLKTLKGKKLGESTVITNVEGNMVTVNSSWTATMYEQVETYGGSYYDPPEYDEIEFDHDFNVTEDLELDWDGENDWYWGTYGWGEEVLDSDHYDHPLDIFDEKLEVLLHEYVEEAGVEYEGQGSDGPPEPDSHDWEKSLDRYEKDVYGD